MQWSDFGDLLHAMLLLPLLLGSFAVGTLVQRRLPEAHRGPRTHEMLRVVMDMLVTFAAIVLGLLITTAKTSFDAAGDDVRTYAIDIITLDQSLRGYGSQAAPLHGLVLQYTRDVLGEITPHPAASGLPVQDAPGGTGIGAAATRRIGLIGAIGTGLRALHPADELSQHLQNEALEQVTLLQRQRYRIGDEAHGEPSFAFYAVLTAWLMVVFACFGLITEHSWLGSLMVSLSVLAIVLALFVILDMSTPFSGLLSVSDQPLRDALAAVSEA